MPRIELINVSKRWKDFVAVDNLNMVIEDREFITLLGPSGCGKTTTLRMIAGLETPTEGKIIIGDQVVFDSEEGINVSPAKRNIGFLFQNYALWPHMTVYKNIAFGLENLKWSKEEIEERVQEVLKTLKIEEFRDRYPAELSGGQQQRVAIARTLAPKPSVLFMDEPLSNLDAKLRGEMRTELKRLHQTTDSTFVYVTHDQLEAMALATRVCLIEKGVMQQYAHPLHVYNRPANLFVADFVGNPTMNFIPARVSNIETHKMNVEFLGYEFEYETEEEITLTGAEATIGIRPEFLPITESGKLNGKVYSTLPAGMETTVKISIDDTLISSVVFGSVDYQMDQDIKFDVIGKGIVVFDPETTKRVCVGSLKVLGKVQTK